MNKDLYGILGVDRTADDKKLKSAYRKLAKNSRTSVKLTRS